MKEIRIELTVIRFLNFSFAIPGFLDKIINIMAAEII